MDETPEACLCWSGATCACMWMHVRLNATTGPPLAPNTTNITLYSAARMMHERLCSLEWVIVGVLFPCSSHRETSVQQDLLTGSAKTVLLRLRNNHQTWSAADLTMWKDWAHLCIAGHASAMPCSSTGCCFDM